MCKYRVKISNYKIHSNDTVFGGVIVFILKSSGCKIVNFKEIDITDTLSFHVVWNKLPKKESEGLPYLPSIMSAKLF